MTFNYKSGSCVDDLELLNEQKVNTDSNDGAENLDQERDQPKPDTKDLKFVVPYFRIGSIKDERL